jgi:hypothetical protein
MGATMRTLTTIMVCLMAAGTAFADAKNPILEDPPGTVRKALCTIVEDPGGKGYLASVPTICPVGFATVSVTVPDEFDPYEVVGKPMMMDIRVNEGRTYTVLSITAPPTPVTVPARIQPPAASPPPTAMIGVLAIGFALGAAFIGLAGLIVSRLPRKA